MSVRLVPASDASVLVVLGERAAPEVSAQVHAWLRALAGAAPPWLVDLHPAYASLLVEYDLCAVGQAEVLDWLRDQEPRAVVDPSAPCRVVEVPVRYGGDDGPDLPALAAHAGLSVDEVVRRHSGARYSVAFLGFSPGFAYLHGLPSELHMPRLASPRPRVPAGSVAIGGEQAGIYPSDTPGGWRILGRTARPLPEDWVQPGDEVRFVVERGPP